MQKPTDSDSRSPPQPGSVVTLAPTGPRDDPAQPSLTSGFGAVLVKEHDLQTATEDSFGQGRRPHSTGMDRILRHQHSRLGANIALLGQRYEALPSPERFISWRDRKHPPGKPRRTRRAETEVLPDLIARHTCLLADIAALIRCAPDGQRGELILSEVSRNHEEMTGILQALLKKDEPAMHLGDGRVADSTGGTKRAQERWDNEGGQVLINPPAR